MENGGEPSNPFAAPDDASLSFDLDLDLDARPVPAPARPTVKFRPKFKGKLLPKPEPSSEPDATVRALHAPRAVNKREDSLAAEKTERMDSPGEPEGADAFGYEKAEEKVYGDAAPTPMDIDEIGEEEDVVVREIDVFFKPSSLDADTQLPVMLAGSSVSWNGSTVESYWSISIVSCWNGLTVESCRFTLLYVMQYPLRPCWRPYELNERCQEVRIKPKQSELEFDMTMDVDSENYDEDVDDHLRLRKQVLSSSKIPYVTGYAVGILVGNKLHLNPVHAVIQLRPSMAHVDASGLHKKKQVAQSVGVANAVEEKGEESAKPSASRGKMMPEALDENADDSEDWVSLEYHAVDSPISSRYQKKMLSEEGDHIAFFMSTQDYLNCLCPGALAENMKTRGPSRRILLSMPLDERLKMLFMEGPHVHRFDTLMHLAPEPVDDVLRIIQKHAVLVQGLWVSKSSLVYSGPQAIVRDYILSLFTKKNTIPISKFKEIKVPMEALKRILNPLAFERSICNDWKFKEPTDLSFIKRYPEIVKMQESFWSRLQEHITDALRGIIKSQPVTTKSSTKPGLGVKTSGPGSVDQSLEKGNEVIVTSGMTSMSDEICEALPKALGELFRKHRVCSMNQIRQGLRDMAVSKSTLPKADPRLFVLAAHGASAPAAELEPIICEVAERIHDVYVPKSGINQALNPLRNVVINLLRGKPRTEKLKKEEMVEAVKIVLKKQFSASDYSQVLNELCVSNRGAGWQLKGGDEMPK